MGVSLALQVSRRAAVTTVAVVVTTGWPSASFCSSSTVQCWVERLVRTARAPKVKAPDVSAPA